MPAPNRHSPRRTGRHAALSVSLLLLAALFGLGAAFLMDALSPLSADTGARTMLVFVPPGATTRQIGALLERRGVIRHGFAFALAARLEHVSGKIKAGHYDLSPAMPPRQIALLLALGHTASDIVVVPEGFTVAQIARRLAEKRMTDEAAFVLLATTQGQTFHADGFTPPNTNLEGYLYPDTYRIPKGASARDIITLMLQNFQERVLKIHGPALASYPGGLSSAVTLASLVEREAETDADRPLVSAVLTNRLAKHMRLQCDASVQYGLPQHKTRLLFSDLRVDSPYNTYRHAGLPPTPICCPGLPSIEAALTPAPADYLFYVARRDGGHIFTRTLAEHDRAIAQLKASGARN